MAAPQIKKVCKGCGELHDYPWGYCLDCTACCVDMSRPPEHRLNNQPVLDAQIEKMRAYEESITS